MASVKADKRKDNTIKHLRTLFWNDFPAFLLQFRKKATGWQETGYGYAKERLELLHKLITADGTQEEVGAAIQKSGYSDLSSLFDAIIKQSNKVSHPENADPATLLDAFFWGSFRVSSSAVGELLKKLQGTRVRLEGFAEEIKSLSSAEINAIPDGGKWQDLARFFGEVNSRSRQPKIAWKAGAVAVLHAFFTRFFRITTPREQGRLSAAVKQAMAFPYKNRLDELTKYISSITPSEDGPPPTVEKWQDLATLFDAVSTPVLHSFFTKPATIKTQYVKNQLLEAVKQAKAYPYYERLKKFAREISALTPTEVDALPDVEAWQDLAKIFGGVLAQQDESTWKADAATILHSFFTGSFIITTPLEKDCLITAATNAKKDDYLDLKLIAHQYDFRLLRLSLKPR